MKFKQYLTEKEENLIPVQPSIARSLKMIDDNPGGNWLKFERQRLSNKKTLGSMTALIERVTLPVQFLSKLKGWNNEHIHISKDKLDPLMKSIKDKGFDPKHKPLIAVIANGDVYVLEGNHRIRASNQLGIKSIPVEIRYFTGGEMVKGIASPDKILRMKK